MNNFSDQAIILSTRPHGEGGAVVSVLTENHGRWNGYVNGAQSSKRLRALLQCGQQVSVDWQTKSEGQLGRFDIESEADITARIIDDPKALTAVQSLCALIDRFLPERELHPALFHGTNAFLDIIGTAEWQPMYIVWEMAFLKELGYGIDLSKCAVTGVTDNLTHVSPKSGRAVCAAEAEPYKHKLLPIPNFLIWREFEDDDMAKGLALTSYFLIHRLLQQSSYQTLPEARMSLENMFNTANMAG